MIIKNKIKTGKAKHIWYSRSNTRTWLCGAPIGKYAVVRFFHTVLGCQEVVQDVQFVANIFRYFQVMKNQFRKMYINRCCTFPCLFVCFVCLRLPCSLFLLIRRHKQLANTGVYMAKKHREPRVNNETNNECLLMPINEQFGNCSLTFLYQNSW